MRERKKGLHKGEGNNERREGRVRDRREGKNQGRHVTVERKEH